MNEEKSFIRLPPRRFGHESVDVGEALVPKVDGYVDDVGDEAECRQGRVQEQGVQASLVSAVWKSNMADWN